MAKNDIASKLKQLLSTPLNTEPAVVYFLVEARKALDHDRAGGGGNPYPIIRFYADWVVHTEKSRTTPQIQVIMSALDAAIPADVHTRRFFTVPDEHRDFIYGEELRRELVQFAADVSLPDETFTEEDLWVQFLSHLVQILTDQPIMNPTPTIESFCFLPATAGAVIWMVTFRDARGTLKFGNAY